MTETFTIRFPMVIAALLLNLLFCLQAIASDSATVMERALDQFAAHELFPDSGGFGECEGDFCL